VLLTNYSSNKGWKSKYFFAQGEWKSSPSEIIKDSSIPWETCLPSIAGQEEPVLDKLEKSWVDQLLDYA
jgi:hypothetical protein